MATLSFPVRWQRAFQCATVPGSFTHLLSGPRSHLRFSPAVKGLWCKDLSYNHGIARVLGGAEQRDQGRWKEVERTKREVGYGPMYLGDALRLRGNWEGYPVSDSSSGCLVTTLTEMRNPGSGFLLRVLSPWALHSLLHPAPWSVNSVAPGL